MLASATLSVSAGASVVDVLQQLAGDRIGITGNGGAAAASIDIILGTV